MNKKKLIYIYRPARTWVKDGMKGYVDHTYTTNYREAKERAERDQMHHAELGYGSDDVRCHVEAANVYLEDVE
jgi:23S rRNA G2445 N2-methylase RlmL